MSEYALNLAKNGRVLSATDPKYAPSDAAHVAELPGIPAYPSDDIADFIYINGEFIYDPLPKPEPPVPTQPTGERLKALEAKNEALTTSNQFLEDCIAEMAGVVYA